MEDIFDSSVRSRGDFAGVFEFEEETAYFYLCATSGESGQKVLDAIHILSGEPDFAESDISIRWDVAEEKVGLFIRHTLWAIFDCARQTKYGGNYCVDAKPSLPEASMAGF